MLLASDEDIRTAAAVIEPLLQLAGSPALSWSASPTWNGYTVSEISAAPSLNLPLKCFRTQFVVNADVETLERTIVSEDAIRKCDPTLKDIQRLQTDRCNTLLYTAYTSPSPWLISPRDFCVLSASVLTTPAQLSRVCPETPATLFPEYLRAGEAAAHSTVLVQNSRSTTSSLCPPPTAAGGTYIRGFVHCYGYVAWPDGRQPNRLHVTNFCCVDACGRIPKWVMAAAVDQNTQKLKRIAQLAEETARQRRETTPTPPMLPRSPGSTERRSEPQQQQQQPKQSQEGIATPSKAFVPTPSSSSPPSAAAVSAAHVPLSDPEEPVLSSASLNTRVKRLSRALPLHPPTQGDAAEQLHNNDNNNNDSDDGAAPVGVQTPGTTMSPLTETLSATPPRSCPPSSPPRTPPSNSLPPSGRHSTLLYTTPPRQRTEVEEGETQPDEKTSAQATGDGEGYGQEVGGAREPPGEAQLPSRRLLDEMISPLAHLARAHGWHAVREMDGIEYAELRSLPLSLRMKDDVAVALRVSTEVQGSLDAVEDVLRDPARSPEIDPELMRLVAAPTPSQMDYRTTTPLRFHNSPAAKKHSWDAKNSRNDYRATSTAVDQKRAGSTSSLTAATPPRHAAAVAVDQIRHFQFNAAPPFSQAWSMELCCTEGELSPYEGGHFGFHTPGVPAATYVWLGSSNGSSSSSRSDGPCNSANGNSYTGRSRATAYHRMHARVFGVVAIAIPRSANTVRLTHYFLFGDPDQQPSAPPSVAQTDSHFAVKKNKVVAADFLSAVLTWMGHRMHRLRGLCEAQQRLRMQDTMASLDKEPLLRYLYQVHRAQQTVTPSGTPRRIGDVEVACSLLLAKSACESTSIAEVTPPLYVFTLVFPCTLRHLQAYMQATAARSRYTMDERVVFFSELASPPGFHAIRMEVCDINDGDSVTGAGSPASFAFLETCGLVREHEEVEQTALVLSRVNCDELQRAACGVTDAESSASAIVAAEADVTHDCTRVGRIYCSGWVATSLSENDSEELREDGEGDASNDAAPSSVSSSLSPRYSAPQEGTGKRAAVRRVVAAAKRSLSRSPKRNLPPLQETEEQPTTEASGILVTQYMCMNVMENTLLAQNSNAGNALSSSFVEREAVLLQRFRDAVCAWRSK